MKNTNKAFLQKTSLDYAKDKNLPVKYFPTSVPTDEVILKETNEVYQKNYGVHKKGDKKYKKVFKYRTLYNNIFSAWKAITNIEPHAKQVSSGLNHKRRDILICDIDVEINDPDVIEKLKNMNCNYIIRNPKTKHLQVGWKYDKPLWVDYGGSKIHRNNILKINEYVRQQVAKRNKDVDLSKVGDDCYTGWQCKNLYCKDLELLYLNEERTIPNNLECLNVVKHYNVASTKTATVTVAKATAKATGILNTIPSFYCNNTNITVNDKQSRDYYIYTNLRTAIWNFMRNNDDKQPSFDEMWSMAQQLNKEAAVKTGKGLMADNEVLKVVKCTGKWAVDHFRRLDNTTNEGSFYRNKATRYENAVRYAKSLILWGKVKNETGSTREVAAKLGVSANQVSIMRRKTLEEVMKLYNECQILVNVKKENENKQKYEKLLEEVQLVYLNVLSSFYCNNTNITVNKTIDKSVEQTEKTKVEQVENSYLTWGEFRQSQVVWDTLRHRPTMKDYIDYKYNKLTVRVAS